MIFVVCGVSGAGKTTVGRLLAQRIDARFVDADDYHPPANVEKMRRGEPLEDGDREPWLTRLADLLDDLRSNGDDAVLACSALKRAHRERLGIDQREIVSVFLGGGADLIMERISRRDHEFMPPELLASQFEALEPPAGGICVSIEGEPEEVTDSILRQLGQSGVDR
ncbi:MAG: gluconokinase [Gammaproteobacteria bacterium]|nr:gluconokinase [Gammaproteobacteria bacterium]